MYSIITNLRSRISLIGMVALLMVLTPVPLLAQASSAVVSFDAFSCPKGYTRIMDCHKLAGVSIRVFADGQPVADLTSVIEGLADVAVLPGQAIALELLGGAPENSLLEPTPFEFDAVAGVNPVTFVFVLQDPMPEPLDTDGDGLADDEEATLGTDPNNPDTDGDGLQDGAEIEIGTDPLNLDTDGDGYPDGEEVDRQSDPLDPDSFPLDSEPNSITLTAYTCPAGYEGKDLFADCTTPTSGVEFTFSLNASEFGVTATTDSTGNVAFSDLGGGAFTLYEDLADLGFGLERYTAICFAAPLFPDAPEPRQVNAWPLGDGAYGFELTAGEDITCTWFNIPANGADAPEPLPEPTEAPPSPTTPVKHLPSTGSGPADTSIARNEHVVSGALAALLVLGVGAAWHTRRTT